jgi:hypothetical protein
MKLIHFFNGRPHHKNYEALIRMCKSLSIDYEETNNLERIMRNDYNILVSPGIFIDPNLIPSNIKIIFGPQFFVFPNRSIIGKNRGELTSRCVYNVLSNWNYNVHYEFVNEFIMPLKELPYGIDTEKFKPLNKEIKEIDCLLYIKRRSNEIINFTINLLNKKNINYKIFKYGSYKEQEYLNTLHNCKFLLSLDAHESQGFALQEAMSTNTPLLVLDATSMYDETDNGVTFTYLNQKPKKLLCTSVPYWSDECGLKITNINELENSLEYMMNNYSAYNPRKYILENLSDKICMKRILNYFNL